MTNSPDKAAAMRHLLTPIMAFSIVGKGLGMARQLLMAHYFGASRAVDVYFMAYNLSLLFATPAAFTLSMTAMIYRNGPAGGVPGGTDDPAGIVPVSGLAIGGLVGAVFIAFIGPAVYLLAWGFSPADKSAVVRMMMCFAPWVALSSVYAVYAGVLKGARVLRRVLWSEVVVSVVSAGIFLAWHPHLESMAYGLAWGHAAGIAVLFFHWKKAGIRSSGSWAFIRHVCGKGMTLLLTQQSSHPFAMAQRFFESHLKEGSLSLLGYSTTLIAPLHEVVNLREYYLPSLIQKDGRADKVNRLLAGMVFLAVPISAFLYFNARDVIGFVSSLARWQRIDPSALAAVFGICSLSIVLSAVTTPLFRILQMEDPLRKASAVNLVSALALAAPAYVLVTRGGFDVKGLAWSIIFSNLAAFYATLALLRRHDPLVNAAEFHRTALLVGAVSAGASWAAHRVAGTSAPLPGLLVSGTIFALALSVLFFLERRSLRRIFGEAS
jgi:putative peptidoglycan lipid II flippase